MQDAQTHLYISQQPSSKVPVLRLPVQLRETQLAQLRKGFYRRNEHASSYIAPEMPSRRALRSAAAARLEQLDALDVDYVGQYPAKRTKPNAGAQRRSLRTAARKAPLNDRAARASLRAGAKRSNTEQPEGQTASTRRGKRQRVTEDNEAGEAGGGDDDNDDEDHEEEGRMDYDHIAQSINRGRHGPQRTVNGLGAPQCEQPQSEDGEEHVEEDNDKEGLFMDRSSEDPRGRRTNTAPNGHGGASMFNRDNLEPTTRARVPGPYELDTPPEQTRTRQRATAERGTKNKTKGPHPTNRPNASQHKQPVQNQESRDDSVSSFESQGEARGDAVAGAAEDSAFIENPRPHEKPVLVKINSMGGIFKTLRHQAWTGRADWDRSFESHDKSNGDPTACKTVSGKAFMKAAKSLNRLLEKAIDAWTESEEANNDDIHAATEYLRGRSADTGACIAAINQAVERICTVGLAPPTPAADEESAGQATKKRRRVLREISRRLIPLLIILVNKACGLAVSEDQRSRKTIYFNTFTLQFFLRTTNWTNRLHHALCRGLERWPFDPEFRKDDKDLDNEEQKTKKAKVEARQVFRDQLDSLHGAAKRAEWALQEEAASQAVTQRQEASRLRAEEQGRLAIAAKEREDEEKRDRDAERYAHFARFTQTLPLAKNPMQEKWELDQAARQQASQSASARSNNTLSQGIHHSQSQRTAGMVRFQIGTSRAGPSRNDRVEDPDDWDPFLEDPPSQNRVTFSDQLVRSRFNGFGITQRSSQANSPAYRPWTYEEDKTLVKSIRYNRNYNLASMAAVLGRSEHDVAQKVASLKQGYRAKFIERGGEIPAYAL